jgi:hypothetical protein
MVAALNDFRPEALTAYPSVAAALAEEQLQGRLRIAPATVATSSEVQTADMRRRMAEAWEVAPLDFYGTTEALVPAAGRQGQTGRRWRGGGAPVPAAGAVLGAAGGPSVPGRPRPGRPARDRGPARGRPGGHPGPRRGRPGSRAARAGAVPPPVEVTPVAGIDRDPGHGAKLKLVRNAVSGR